MTRSERVIAGMCLAGAACLLAAAPARASGPGGAQFYTDAGLFAQTLQDINKVSKAQWDFKPDFLPPGILLPIDDILDINSHPLVAPGVWSDAAGNNVWPDDVDNVQFSSNVNPQGPFEPRGPGGMFYAKNGFEGLDNNVLGAVFPPDSFHILSGPPAGDNHTAISFEVVVLPGGAPPFFHITVYNKEDIEIGKLFMDWTPGAKLFIGIIAPPGDTIHRVDIWDANQGREGISNIALYLQPEQLPWCPWDCGIPHDKVINVIDFLALLAQWGQVGVPCDFDGGGVGVTDFLKLLAVWGPCPAPVNDECANKPVLDRVDPAGQIIEHFDMYGATPSPEPSQCLGVPNIWKDIWYCLQNNSTTKKRVTLTGSVDLFAEVTAGCVCPPGPLVACGRLVLGDAMFEMQPGEQVCIRLINDLSLPNDGIKGDLIITNEPVQTTPVNFYTDPGQFFQAIQQAGKFSKFFWDFKPYFLPPGTIAFLRAPLDIFTHPANPIDPWTDPAGINLWPPEVDNVQFTNNFCPQGPLCPGDIDALAFTGPGNIVDVDNNFLFETLGTGSSFDILSGPPAGDNHTAFALEVMSIFGLPPGTVPALIHVSVYDKNDVEIGKFTIKTFNGFKTFLGILSKDPTVTISRIDIWDVQGGLEGISFIEAFLQDLPPSNDCSPPGVCGTYQVCGTGVPFNCLCWEVDNDPTVAGICIQDFLCADVQPCPAGGCPPGFVCITNSCCGPAFCVPIVKCDQPGVTTPQSTSTGLTGSGQWIEPVDD
ncbi:MAG: hypothetical protein ACYSU7_20180 [Planctomycetota bacterium]